MQDLSNLPKCAQLLGKTNWWKVIEEEIEDGLIIIHTPPIESLVQDRFKNDYMGGHSWREDYTGARITFGGGISHLQAYRDFKILLKAYPDYRIIYSDHSKYVIARLGEVVRIQMGTDPFEIHVFLKT